MDEEKLVRMANQISDFFKSYPEDAAKAGIVEHIAQFWTPKMRTLFTDRLATRPDGVQPIVVRAFTQPSPAESPILKETQGPGELGQLVSDAG